MFLTVRTCKWNISQKVKFVNVKIIFLHKLFKQRGYTQSLRRKQTGSVNRIWEQSQRNVRKSTLAPISTHTPVLHTHTYTHTPLHEDYSTETHTWAHSEGNSEVFVQRALWRDEARNYDAQIPFICFTSGASVVTAGSHPSSAGECVCTTYPQCTAAAARSTLRWTQRWPARFLRAALWQWHVGSSPLAPTKRKKGTNMYFIVYLFWIALSGRSIFVSVLCMVVVIYLCAPRGTKYTVAVVGVDKIVTSLTQSSTA